MTIWSGADLICMERRPALVLANVQVPGGRRADIAIRDGRVVHTGAGSAADQVIDCTGLFVLPAAVDIHVHMRGGSQSAKEDWKTGSTSALAGGVTVVVDQPNTIPPLTTSEAFITRVHEAQAHSLCSFAINSGVTPDTPFEAMWKAGAMAFGETFFAPSSYGKALDAPELSRALGRIRGLGGLATIHAEGIAPGEDTNLAAHDSLRSPEGEREAVIAVQACNPVGCRIHFCHMSTAGAIDAAKGTVEVTPHHLLLSREKTGSADSRFKVNPPVRTEAERRALWTRWERIDIIASDHAPHTKAEKALPFPDAPSGVPGVETMVPLLMAEMIDRRITLTDLVQKTATAPAALIGIPPAGFVPGDRADFALYPRSAVTVEPEILHSRCGWTPFEGCRAVFPETVIMGGAVVYRDGEFFRGNPSWFAGRGHVPQSQEPPGT
ncbi:dihydroorotase [Methanoregula sp.]|uniref:dihydroorotase n=1 Tax=Methanoregula sp. TaxID=2052170 RepID=UPI003BAE7A79